MSGYKIEFICEPFQVKKPHGISFSDGENKLIDLEVVQKMLQKVLLDAPRLSPEISFLTCLLYRGRGAI